MKLGLYMATQWRQGADLAPELANLIEQVRVARASGLASLMVGQHFLSTPLQMFQAMPLLSRLAAEAQGMQIGPGLLLLPLLNPVIVAEECATLDWLAGGKAIIGLGLGYRKEEFDSIGVPFKERVPRFVEGVEVIRKLWRDDVVEHKGRFHTVSGVSASLKPQQKNLPIWMAGDVEAAVKRAAKLSDAWFPSPMVSEENVTKPDAAQRESDHAFPSVLPGGRGVLFTITAMGRADNAQVAVLDLRTGRREMLVRGGGQAEYIEPSTGSLLASVAGSARGGYLIYAAPGTLRAIRFDPVRLEVLGDPVTVVQDVLTKASGGANYAVSRPGTLVYIPGAAAETPIRSLVWVDRKGHEEPIATPLRAYGPPRLSPDGTRVATSIEDQGNIEVWIWDLARETLRRLTFSSGAPVGPTIAGMLHAGDTIVTHFRPALKAVGDHHCLG